MTSPAPRTLGGLCAAAGHPNSLFALTADELVRMTQGRVADVAEVAE